MDRYDVRRYNLLAFAVTLIYIFLTGLASAIDQVESNCKPAEGDAERNYIDVHLGWPFALSCAELNIPYDEEFYDQTSTAECVVRDVLSGAVLWNHSLTVDEYYFVDDLESNAYKIPEITEDLPSTYVIMLRAIDFCTFKIVYLNKTNAIETQCDSSPVEIQREFPATQGATHSLGCSTMSGPELYLEDEHMPYVNYTWYHNCSEIKNAQMGPNGQLFIYNAQFENTGSYVCVVSYKGKRRSVVQQNLCLKYKPSVNQQFAVKCTAPGKVPIGGNATVTCVVDLGVGQSNSVYHAARWEKIDAAESSPTFVCRNLLEGIIVDYKNETTGVDAQCMLKAKRLSSCYSYKPDHSAPPHDEAIATLTIKNVKESDLGSYRMTFNYLSREADANFTIYADKRGLLKSQICAISICAALFALFIILLILCLWRKYDVMWYWKKHFGPYEKEIFTYTAYLAYYYDTQSQTISKKSLKLTENLVVALSEWMEKFGGTTYDDQKEISPNQYDTETILRVQSECHRIVIVLTPEYITDQWSLHTTYMALTNIVECKNKVIFITSPGFKKALEMVDEKPRRTLLSAMKRNITITWTGKTPFSGKFRRRLEYALPKLPPPGYNRYLSTSSHAHLTRHGKHHLPGSPASNETNENGFSSMVV